MIVFGKPVKMKYIIITLVLIIIFVGIVGCSKVEFDPKQSDPNYITLWEDIIDGERRLVDMSGNVYTFDTVHPRYLGKKSLDGKIE